MKQTDISLRICESCLEPMIAIEDTGETHVRDSGEYPLEYVCYTCHPEVQASTEYNTVGEKSYE